MATNFEFYKDEILEISGNKMEIAIVNNRPVPCERTDCTDCDFQCNCSECYVVLWLYAEHIEAPKLTKRERAFCEAVQTGWIARDYNNDLYFYEHKPIKEDNHWDVPNYESNPHELPKTIVDLFDFIKWTDEEAWAVEDLLKLDVMEEVQEDA